MSKQSWQEPVDLNLRDRLAAAIGADDGQSIVRPWHFDAASTLLPVVQAEIDRALHAERERIAAAIRAQAEEALRDGLEVVPVALDLAADIALEPEALNHA